MAGSPSTQFAAFSYGVSAGAGRDHRRHDSFSCAEAGLGLFAVADSCADNGEWVIPRTAIRALRQFIAETSREADIVWPCAVDPSLSVAGNRLRAGLIIAARSIETIHGSPLEAPISIASILLDEKAAAVVAAGNCRVYLARHRRFRRIQLSPLAAAGQPGKSLSAFDVLQFPWQEGDRWLLCSGAVHDAVAEGEISSALLDVGRSPELVTEGLVELVAQRDRAGNAVAIVVCPFHLTAERSSTHPTI